jgi:excisionase family DNA binding protein
MLMKKTEVPDDRLLTRTEVAEIFQVAPSTVTRWAEEGKLPSVKTLGGHHRYEAKAVMELIQHLLKKEETDMENALLSVPAMYADHHVIAVRNAIKAMPGVADVWASSAWRQVQVTYDPALLSPQDISRALEQAGYPAGEGQFGEGEALVAPTPGLSTKDPAWDALGARVTETNQADLTMSGEFRRY